MRMSDCWLECKPCRNSNLPLTDLPSVGLIPRSFALGKRLYERALRATKCGQVAQLVEQRTENPRVGGSIPPLATIPSTSMHHEVPVKAGCEVCSGMALATKKP